MSHTMLDVHVALPVPDGATTSEATVAAELLLLWLVEQVRRKQLGIGKAAELAGVPRAAFMQALGAHGVPVIDYGADDLERELRSLGIP